MIELLLLVGLPATVFAVLAIVADGWERRDAYSRNHGRARKW